MASEVRREDDMAGGGKEKDEPRQRRAKVNRESRHTPRSEWWDSKQRGCLMLYEASLETKTI